MERPRSRHQKPASVTGEAKSLKAELVALTERASAGDEVALVELRHVLDAHPAVWRAIGDLTALSVACWTRLIAGSDALGMEAMTRFVEDWKGELAGPDATPAERALADVAAVARLALSHAEFGASGSSDSVVVAAFKARRLDAALHRLTAVIRLLAQVRAARHRGGRAPASPPAAAELPRPYVPQHERKVAV